MKKTSAQTAVKLFVGFFLIALTTLWTYHGTTENLFVWDTKDYLFAHEFWISSLNIYHIMWMFSSLEVSNWHPLTWVSWAIDYQLYGGLVPWGYHFTNNVLHALNSGLVFILTLVLFGLNSPESKNYPLRTDNNALIAAFMAALFFAIHPQHVESVAWVAERKDLLCQFFLLLSMLTYVKYVTCHEDVRTGWYRGTLGLFVMALLSKPMAVTFPVVLLLLDVYPLRRTTLIHPLSHTITQQPTYKLLREKLPFFLFSISLVLITLLAQRTALSTLPFDVRVLNAFNSIILYLNKLLFPLYFSPYYPYFEGLDKNNTWELFVPLVGVLGLTLACLYAWLKGHRAWMTAWLFYLVTLSPVLGLIQVGQQGAADRYAYFPTLPAYLLMGSGILIILNKITPNKKVFLLLIVIPFVYLLANKTSQQIPLWESDYVLWSSTIEDNPDNFVAHMVLGTYHLNLNNYKEAANYFEKAAELRPQQIDTLAWSGLTYLYLSRFEDAIAAHVKLGIASESVPELRADQFCIQYNIGWLYAQLGMFEESGELFSRVDRNSRQGSDALTWLNWLEENNHLDEIATTNGDLPSFCRTLIPPMKSGARKLVCNLIEIEKHSTSTIPVPLVGFKGWVLFPLSM